MNPKSYPKGNTREEKKWENEHVECDGCGIRGSWEVYDCSISEFSSWIWFSWLSKLTELFEFQIFGFGVGISDFWFCFQNWFRIFVGFFCHIFGKCTNHQSKSRSPLTRELPVAGMLSNLYSRDGVSLLRVSYFTQLCEWEYSYIE